MVKTIRDQLDGDEELNEEQMNEVAQKWMEIADVDGNGFIDKTEFVDLVNKLEDGFNSDKLDEIFAAQDTDDNGQLSVQNFGAALFESCKLMKNHEEEVNS